MYTGIKSLLLSPTSSFGVFHSFFLSRNALAHCCTIKILRAVVKPHITELCSAADTQHTLSQILYYYVKLNEILYVLVFPLVFFRLLFSMCSFSLTFISCMLALRAYKLVSCIKLFAHRNGNTKKRRNLWNHRTVFSSLAQKHTLTHETQSASKWKSVLAVRSRTLTAHFNCGLNGEFGAHINNYSSAEWGERDAEICDIFIFSDLRHYNDDNDNVIIDAKTF